MPLGQALAKLRASTPVLAPRSVEIRAALGRALAEPIRAPQSLPPRATALRDGWAVSSAEVIGASPYSPVLSAEPPQWVEAGAAMPAATDAVLPVDDLSTQDGFTEIVASVAPGEHVRRAGADAGAGAILCAAGQHPRPSDVAVALAAGVEHALIREARVNVLALSGRSFPGATAELAASLAEAAGAAVTRTALPARDADTIARALSESQGDLNVVVGGAGLGRQDHAAEALATAGSLIAHGIALRPGDTSGCGLVGTTPVILIPGSLDAALAVTLFLVLPCLDHLIVATPRPLSVSGRLTRKLSSSVGLVELALLRADGPSLEPLAIGDLTLETIGRATAWLPIPADSEGIAAGETVTAFLL